MRFRLLARLQRLESQTAMGKPALFRYGWLKPLPSDYAGERHVGIVKREQTTSPGIEWCEFEERPGPAPAGIEDRDFTVYLTRS
jgi:hypothetical protein